MNLNKQKTMHCFPQRLKLTFFEIFSIRGSQKVTRSEEIFSKNTDFSLWGNQQFGSLHNNLKS